VAGRRQGGRGESGWEGGSTGGAQSLTFGAIEIEEKGRDRKRGTEFNRFGPGREKKGDNESGREGSSGGEGGIKNYCRYQLPTSATSFFVTGARPATTGGKEDRTSLKQRERKRGDRKGFLTSLEEAGKGAHVDSGRRRIEYKKGGKKPRPWR